MKVMLQKQILIFLYTSSCFLSFVSWLLYKYTFLCMFYGMTSLVIKSMYPYLRRKSLSLSCLTQFNILSCAYIVSYRDRLSKPLEKCLRTEPSQKKHFFSSTHEVDVAAIGKFTVDHVSTILSSEQVFFPFDCI